MGLHRVFRAERSLVAFSVHAEDLVLSRAWLAWPLNTAVEEGRVVASSSNSSREGRTSERVDEYAATVPPLSPAQLQSAAKDFLDNASSDPLESRISPSEADRSSLCREAQNTLRAAIQSADSAIVTGTLMNRLSKVKDGKEVRGGWAYPAQDSLRAAVLFAGAGLDRSLKRLAEDALPVLIEFDDMANGKFQDFATEAITDGEAVDAKRLVSLLLGRGQTPRDTMVRAWIYKLGSASAQSAERVSEFASALGVDDPTLRERMSPTKKKSKALEKAFGARNDIAHELDVTDPEAEVRKRLERIRRARSVTTMRDHVVEMLDVTQLVINDVANRLEANGYAQ